jgi:MoxR-like ATPase
MSTAINGASAVTDKQAIWFAQSFDSVVTNIGQALLGRPDVVRLAVTCLLSEGHLLIEDVPGTGKTSLAKALANSVQGTHSRIQFTPDLLPSDVTGVNIYDQRTFDFDFRNGPIFATIVLADEINRASPKTQSALLEVMEEGHVTIDGEQRSVGKPFMVIATQNPIEQAGTYRLPEAQLDRFLMKTSIGYPDHATTVALLASAATRDRAGAVENVITTAAITQMSGLADKVHVDPGILGYVSELATNSRKHGQLRLGLSVRGCLALVRVAKTWALADGRSYVLTDDVKALAEPVLSHRLLLTAEDAFNGVTIEDVIDQLLRSVHPPTVRAK